MAARERRLPHGARLRRWFITTPLGASQLGSWVLGLPFWVAKHVLPALVAVVGAFFSILLLTRVDQDMTPVTNAAFVAIATLAALSLSAARAVEGRAARAYRAAGEWFLFAALLVIGASVVRYGAVLLRGMIQDYPTVHRVVDVSVGILITFVFVWAMALVLPAVRALVLVHERRRVEADLVALEEEEEEALRRQQDDSPENPRG